MASAKREASGPAEVEARLSSVEQEVASLKAKVDGPKSPKPRWWERISGSFADDPAYEKAMKLGRAYRASLRPRKSRTRKV